MAKCPERRTLVRFPVTDMNVSISIRYRLGTHQGEVLEFNRYGVTIELQRSIPLNKPLLVTLRFAGLHPEAIVATAHNCRPVKGGAYRCGIRFRTDSHLQLDRDDVERSLGLLEASLARLESTAAT